MNCIKCGKPLRHPSSIARGMGPTCAGKSKSIKYHDCRKNRADYTYTVEEDFVCIIDMNRGDRSVTNDAENVIQDLVRDGVDLSVRRVIYKDSEGIWDELLVSNKHFSGFRALRTTEVRQAKIRARLVSVNPQLQSI